MLGYTGKLGFLDGLGVATDFVLGPHFLELYFPKEAFVDHLDSVEKLHEYAECAKLGLETTPIQITNITISNFGLVEKTSIKFLKVVDSFLFTEVEEE